MSKAVMNQPRIARLYHYLERGMVDLLQATESIIRDYKAGQLDYTSATAAIKLLSKVKTRA